MARAGGARRGEEREGGGGPTCRSMASARCASSLASAISAACSSLSARNCGGRGESAGERGRAREVAAGCGSSRSWQDHAGSGEMRGDRARLALRGVHILPAQRLAGGVVAPLPWTGAQEVGRLRPTLALDPQRRPPLLMWQRHSRHPWLCPCRDRSMGRLFRSIVRSSLNIRIRWRLPSAHQAAAAAGRAIGAPHRYHRSAPSQCSTA